MDRKVDNATVYRDLVGELSREEMKQVRDLVLVWADAQDKLKTKPNLKIMLAAMVHVIHTMGPAYCNVAASTLMYRASRDELN